MHKKFNIATANTIFPITAIFRVGLSKGFQRKLRCKVLRLISQIIKASMNKSGIDISYDLPRLRGRDWATRK
jgi:hypothetical protein